MGENRVLISLMPMLVAAVLCSSAFANNGIQHYELSDNYDGVYIACLGDTVDIQLNIYASYHEFETPSGKYHEVHNWTETWIFTSNTYDRTWYAKGQSPYQFNLLGAGGTLQWVETFIAKLVSGDGPMFKFHGNRKITLNAHGEWVVDFYNNDGLTFSEEIKCIGKK